MVRPERAGEAAGVTLTVLITLAGVGVAAASTVLEVLQRNGISAASGISLILVVLAAVLLPAGLLATWIGRAAALDRDGASGQTGDAGDRAHEGDSA